MNAVIIEGLIAFVIACAIGGGSYFAGHRNGVNEQKAEDQAQFDKVNAERAKQKTDAAALLTKIQQGITDQVAADALKAQQLQKAADDLLDENLGLRASLASRSLRFVSTGPAKGGANRGCRASPASSTASAAASDAPAVVQLPDALAASLRQLTFDADRLSVEYGKCYGWVYPEVKP